MNLVLSIVCLITGIAFCIASMFGVYMVITNVEILCSCILGCIYFVITLLMASTVALISFYCFMELYKMSKKFLNVAKNKEG